MSLSLPLARAIGILAFVLVVLVFVVFTLSMWRYLENADWGRLDFLRNTLPARLLTGIVIAFVFWLFVSVLFGTVSPWLLSPFS
ncbi:hypothetical protein [Halococcus agarilyticus]|uniref:hypothetical protein n=1 Tax=Halococcus agarilyticus TaxID=1232219 RepID=UPI000677C2C7|nr:hypothetical protein [Halococcus agarilyticus]